MDGEAAAHVPKYFHERDRDPQGKARGVPQEPLPSHGGPWAYFRHRIWRLPDAQPAAHGQRAVHLVPRAALPQSGEEKLQGHGAGNTRILRRTAARPFPARRRLSLGGGGAEILRRR